jgi:hypothetical protein
MDEEIEEILKEKIPVLLIRTDAQGKTFFEAGSRTVNRQNRITQMTEALASIYVEKIQQESNRKIDQRVLSTEIGVKSQ